MNMQNALVVLSGGQDSTTCLFQALCNPEFDEIHTITFDYGQLHVCEIESVDNILEVAKKYYPGKIAKSVVKVIPNILEGTSPLVNRNTEVEQYKDADSLPGGLEKTFVPGRNMLFLTVAANYAYVNNCNTIIIGTSQEDYGGYPDCREDFIHSMEDAINDALGLFDTDLRGDRTIIGISTPLMYLTKKETVQLALELPNCIEALSYSHTCYMGGVPSTSNPDLLVPCGKCHACLLRERGFNEAGIEDPLISRLKEMGAL